MDEFIIYGYYKLLPEEFKVLISFDAFLECYDNDPQLDVKTLTFYYYLRDKIPLSPDAFFKRFRPIIKDIDIEDFKNMSGGVEEPFCVCGHSLTNHSMDVDGVKGRGVCNKCRCSAYDEDEEYYDREFEQIKKNLKK